MQTLDFVSGLHNCLEFSQPLSCLYQAMQTRKTFSIALILQLRQHLSKVQWHRFSPGPLEAEVWYHGPMSRAEAELLLEDEGDFLVRESHSKAGQYVLSGVQKGQPRHLLLVDPQGQVCRVSLILQYNDLSRERNVRMINTY